MLKRQSRVGVKFRIYTDGRPKPASAFGGIAMSALIPTSLCFRWLEIQLQKFHQSNDRWVS